MDRDFIPFTVVSENESINIFDSYKNIIVQYISYYIMTFALNCRWVTVEMIV